MNISHLAQALGKKLLAHNAKITTAESCTGGWIAEAITSVPGSSAWFEQGWVTYSIAAKQRLLGVPAQVIQGAGVVSSAVAKAMAEGALLISGAQIAVAVTGIAGPEGGSVETPVGTICLAWAQLGKVTITKNLLLVGERNLIREETVKASLTGVLELF